MRPNNDAPPDLAVFLGASSVIETSLTALAGAESLTDDLAVYLLESLDLPRPQALITALHSCNFVVERNSEWHLAPNARSHLIDRLQQRTELRNAVHGRLLEIAQNSGLRREFSEVPRYLNEGAGRAYHLSALNASSGLREYVKLAVSGEMGQQWLGSRLAEEQQRLGMLPPDSIEISFLRGMVYYRERRHAEAEPIFRAVASSAENRIEVAIALHIVGSIDAKRRRSKLAEEELRRSVWIGAKIGEIFHRAQALHTLGRMLGGSTSRRTAEAEKLLRESRELLRSRKDLPSEAQVLHTLGQLIGRNRNRASEAEELLRQSLQ
ncbi:hypothetical protein AB0M20_10470, partial [Actinoplanes sp. NPDC051633]|uniref:hypothetical protein n=1 Tax=Actinoplanes sp. NPDC051633 TaxID=3155670 RepID=UPI0034411EE6